MKFTAQDVKQYQVWAKEDPVLAKLIKKDMFQPSIHATGYYKAPSWNWSYCFGLVIIDHKMYEVMTRFGSVVGGRQIYAQRYTKTGKRAK